MDKRSYRSQTKNLGIGAPRFIGSASSWCVAGDLESWARRESVAAPAGIEFLQGCQHGLDITFGHAGTYAAADG